MPSRQQVNQWWFVYWRIYASLDFNELKQNLYRWGTYCWCLWELISLNTIAKPLRRRIYCRSDYGIVGLSLTGIYLRCKTASYCNGYSINLESKHKHTCERDLLKYKTAYSFVFYNENYASRRRMIRVCAIHFLTPFKLLENPEMNYIFQNVPLGKRLNLYC